MKRLLVAALSGLMLALSFNAAALSDAHQKALARQAQEAKQRLSAAQAASGPERQNMMREHMKMMQAMMEQMQKAKPAAGMSPKQKGEWMDEQMKLMQEMMGQMMGEQQMMMEGMGMQGMGGQGMGKK